jgi:hypothetical protein
MNSREVAALALKLLGVYAIIQALSLLQILGTFSIMPQMSRGGIALQAWTYFAALVPFLLVAIVAVVLLTRSEALARLIMKEEQAFTLPGSLTSRDIQTIAFSVAGVFILLHALPGLLQLATGLWYYSSASSGRQSLGDTFIWRSLWTSTVSPVVQCVLGIVLFFRSRGLANLWHSLQSARYVRIDGSQPGDTGSAR